MGGPLRSPRPGGGGGGKVVTFLSFVRYSFFVFHFSFYPFAPGTLAKREVTPFLFSLFPFPDP